MPTQFPAIMGALLAAIVIGFWFWMLRDMLENKDTPENTRDIWIMAFIFLSLFTAAYYYVYIYRERTRYRR